MTVELDRYLREMHDLAEAARYRQEADDETWKATLDVHAAVVAGPDRPAVVVDLDRAADELRGVRDDVCRIAELPRPLVTEEPLPALPGPEAGVAQWSERLTQQTLALDLARARLQELAVAWRMDDRERERWEGSLGLLLARLAGLLGPALLVPLLLDLLPGVSRGQSWLSLVLSVLLAVAVGAGVWFRAANRRSFCDRAVALTEPMVKLPHVAILSRLALGFALWGIPWLVVR
jgi:hypothetical protein